MGRFTMQKPEEDERTFWAKQADEARARLEAERAKARARAAARKEAKEAARRATVGETPLG
jgi:hypothetical protein